MEVSRSFSRTGDEWGSLNSIIEAISFLLSRDTCPVDRQLRTKNLPPYKWISTNFLQLSQETEELEATDYTGSYLGQRISLAIQRGNAASIFETLLFLIMLYKYKKYILNYNAIVNYT